MPTTKEVFDAIESRLNADKAKKINSTYQFVIGEEKWFVDLTKAAGPWIEQKEAEAKCVVTVAKPEDWVALAVGDATGKKLNPTAAFMQNKIKVKGDMGLAMKLQSLLS